MYDVMELICSRQFGRVLRPGGPPGPVRAGSPVRVPGVRIEIGTIEGNRIRAQRIIGIVDRDAEVARLAIGQDVVLRTVGGLIQIVSKKLTPLDDPVTQVSIVGNQGGLCVQCVADVACIGRRHDLITKSPRSGVFGTIAESQKLRLSSPKIVSAGRKVISGAVDGAKIARQEDSFFQFLAEKFAGRAPMDAFFHRDIQGQTGGSGVRVGEDCWPRGSDIVVKRGDKHSGRAHGSTCV